MKTNTLNTLVLVAVGFATALGALVFATDLRAQDEENTDAIGEVRIGTFDSRAVAMAWYRSPTFNKEMTKMHEALKNAKKTGDEAKIKELETHGPALQDLMHKQGFGVWPIDNILKKIEDRIPDVATNAGVTLVVSKWDVVYQKKGLKVVDVTDQLVNLFGPDKATLKVVAEIRKQEPVPLDQLEPSGR